MGRNFIRPKRVWILLSWFVILFFFSACIKGGKKSSMIPAISPTNPHEKPLLTKTIASPVNNTKNPISTLTTTKVISFISSVTPTSRKLQTKTQTPTPTQTLLSIRPNNVQQITPLHILAGEPDLSTRGISFSPDGHILASSLWYQGKPSILLWNVENGELYKVLDSTGYLVVFTPDGSRIAAVSDDSIQMWEVSNFNLLYTRCIHEIPGDEYWRNYIFNISFSPDGNTFVTASNDGFIRFWQTSDGTLIKVLQMYCYIGMASSG